LKLWVSGPLPGLNDLLAAAKSGRGKGNAYGRLKAQWTEAIVLLARAARIGRVASPVRLRFRWIEATRKRDPDNVAAAGRKLVLDGLVEAGVLAGDGWAHVLGWVDTFEIGPRPGVEVSIEPA